MTAGELKFALTLETKLNSLPDPEYRQLVVEALMIFSLVIKSNNPPSLDNNPLLVGDLILTAQQLFLEDQVKYGYILVEAFMVTDDTFLGYQVMVRYSFWESCLLGYLDISLERSGKGGYILVKAVLGYQVKGRH